MRSCEGCSVYVSRGGFCHHCYTLTFTPIAHNVHELPMREMCEGPTWIRCRLCPCMIRRGTKYCVDCRPGETARQSKARSRARAKPSLAYKGYLERMGRD